MKNTLSYIVVLTLLLSSCAKGKKSDLIFAYPLESTKIESFTLNSEEIENIRYFEYLSLNDSLQKMKLQYNIQKNSLQSNLDTFVAIDKGYTSKSLDFKMYQGKEVKGAKKILVFNEKYGLLASLAIGENYLFLKDSITATTKEVLYKELYIELNKVKTN